MRNHYQVHLPADFYQVCLGGGLLDNRPHRDNEGGLLRVYFEDGAVTVAFAEYENTNREREISAIYEYGVLTGTSALTDEDDEMGSLPSETIAMTLQNICSLFGRAVPLTCSEFFRS